MKSKTSVIVSPLLIQILFASVVICVGYQIEDVEATLYPEFFAAWVIYYGIGEMVLLTKGIEPPLTLRVHDGKLDFAWGLKHCYWVHWWPRALQWQ